MANYILDCYCSSEHLAIELDGEVHDNSAIALRDYKRGLFLQATVIKVLRFENKVVLENIGWLLQCIRNEFGWYVL